MVKEPSGAMTEKEAQIYWSVNRFRELSGGLASVENALNRITTKMTAEIFIKTGDVRSDSKVIEVGCGWGRILFGMARAVPGAQFSGIDLNEEVLAEGRRLAEGREVSDRVCFDRMQLESMSFADSSFDLVCSSRAFQYVRDKLKGVRECQRILKEGGVLTIVTPNKLSPARSSYHIPLSGPTEMRNWLADAGFHDVRHGYYGFSRCSGKLTSKLARLLEVARFVPGVRRIGAFTWVSGTK